MHGNKRKTGFIARRTIRNDYSCTVDHSRNLINIDDVVSAAFLYCETLTNGERDNMSIKQKARQANLRLLSTGRTALLVCTAALSYSAFAEQSPVVDTLPGSQLKRHFSTPDPIQHKHGPAVIADDTTRALLNWAVYLSSYESYENVPEVRLESTAFFIENACGGRSDCRVIGWYADRGVVHIHESLAKMDTLFERSLLVHEFVHYLQHQSGQFVLGDCESFVMREREAYAAQQSFFVSYGAMPTIKAHHFSCAGVSDDTVTLSAGR